MPVKLNDVLTFLETKLHTISDLRNKVKVTKKDEPYPGVICDYGVQIYLGDSPKEIIAKKIGNIIHEKWLIQVDLIIHRAIKSRDSYSDPKGVSYWENLITSTLLHQTNSGAFVTSRWEFQRRDDTADCIILRGVYVCELMNRYG